MTITQIDLWDNRHRVQSWEAILIGKLKEFWEADSNLGEQERNKRVVAETFGEIAAQANLINSIQAASDPLLGRQIFVAFFADKDTPAVGTIDRKLRSAKRDLEESGFTFRIAENGDLPAYVDILRQATPDVLENDIEQESLAYRFCDHIKKRSVQTILYKARATLPNGNQSEIDICFPNERIAVLVDTYRFHRDIQSFSADRQRYRQLSRAGWHVMPYSGSELTLPGGFQHCLNEIQSVINSSS